MEFNNLNLQTPFQIALFCFQFSCPQFLSNFLYLLRLPFHLQLFSVHLLDLGFYPFSRLKIEFLQQLLARPAYLCELAIRSFRRKIQSLENQQPYKLDLKKFESQ